MQPLSPPLRHAFTQRGKGETRNGGFISADFMKKCPLCDGKGTVGNLKFEEKEISIKMLRDKGLTYRQIAKVTGIKSIDSIHYYLKRRKNDSY